MVGVGTFRAANERQVLADRRRHRNRHVSRNADLLVRSKLGPELVGVFLPVDVRILAERMPVKGGQFCATDQGVEADTLIPVLDSGRGNFPLADRCIIFIYARPLQSLRNRVKGWTGRGQSELRVGAIKVRDGETRELKGAELHRGSVRRQYRCARAYQRIPSGVKLRRASQR